MARNCSSHSFITGLGTDWALHHHQASHGNGRAAEPIVWDILEEVIKTIRDVNRAPTFTVSAFRLRPVLVEGKAIKIHRWLHGIHADFDGDQMAVHIPRLRKPRLRPACSCFHRTTFCPRSGQPITVPRRTWCWALLPHKGQAGLPRAEGRAFANIGRVLLALEAGAVETLSPIRAALHR